MELRLLKTFSTAARHGSFTRAADELQLTQSAVSQQISALEAELETPLFERRGRGVGLTEAGRKLDDYARQIVDLADEAVRVVGESGQELEGELRIASSTVPSEYLLPDLLAGFRARWPKVRESLSVSDSARATAAVESGAADVGFVGEQPRLASVNAQAVFDDELVLVVARDHPLSERGTVTLNQLKKEPLIFREPGSGSRRCVEQALEGKGHTVNDFTIALEANSNEMIRAAVRHRVGAAFLSRESVRRDLELATVRVRGLQLQRRLYVITSARRTPQSPARQFLEFIDDWKKTQRRRS